MSISKVGSTYCSWREQLWFVSALAHGCGRYDTSKYVRRYLLELARAAVVLVCVDARLMED